MVDDVTSGEEGGVSAPPLHDDLRHIGGGAERRERGPLRRVIENNHSNRYRTCPDDYLQGECSYRLADSVRRFNVG